MSIGNLLLNLIKSHHLRILDLLLLLLQIWLNYHRLLLRHLYWHESLRKRKILLLLLQKIIYLNSECKVLIETVYRIHFRFLFFDIIEIELSVGRFNFSSHL